MKRCSLKNTKGKRKAPFGTVEAATLAAAAIGAGATIAAAATNKKGMLENAKQQAQQMSQDTNRQIQQIKDQANKDKELFKENQEFIAQQNEERNQIAKDEQMMLQMAMAKSNENDRYEATRLVARNGGSIKGDYDKYKTLRQQNRQNLKSDYDRYKQLRQQNRKEKEKEYNNFKNDKVIKSNASSPLRGANMIFRINNYGGAKLDHITPEGYEYYTLKGNDHSHYHTKDNSNKSESGVNIYFPQTNGKVEAEGNQTPGKKGEGMLVTPDNTYFLSKHDIDGFNAVDAVKEGMHPLVAYGIMESKKDKIGLTDDGKEPPVGERRAKLGYKLSSTQLHNDINDVYDYYSPANAGFLLGSNVSRMKCGGNVKKAANGRSLIDGINLSYYPAKKNTLLAYNPNDATKYTLNPNNATTQNNTNGSDSTRFRNFMSNWGAPTVGAIGNIVGTAIGNAGNRQASRIASDAYLKNSRALANAYENLPLIDVNGMSDLIRNSNKSTHVMPAVQTPTSYAFQPITEVNRSLQRTLANAERNSASSMVANSRSRLAEIDAQDARNRIYNADQQQMQQVRNENAKNITEASKANAQLNMQDSANYTAAMLDLMKYRNQTERENKQYAAESIAEGNLASADVLAQARKENSASWSNAVKQSALGYANRLDTMAKARQDYKNILLGVDTENKVEGIVLMNDKETATSLYASFANMLNDPSVSAGQKNKVRGWMAMLNGKFNFEKGV